MKQVHSHKITAMAGQLATISKLRLFQRAGILARDDLSKIEEAIKVQLNIC